jgi:hypothetical protein
LDVSAFSQEVLYFPSGAGLPLRDRHMGFDHSVGHPLLLLCNAKVHNYTKNNGFKHLDNYSEWPKVAEAVSEADICFVISDIMPGPGVPMRRVFRIYGSSDKLIIHHYYHVRYAIPQHSSLVSGNYSNNSPEWTARQEAKSIVCRFVSYHVIPGSVARGDVAFYFSYSSTRFGLPMQSGHCINYSGFESIYEKLEKHLTSFYVLFILSSLW